MIENETKIQTKEKLKGSWILKTGGAFSLCMWPSG